MSKVFEELKLETLNPARAYTRKEVAALLKTSHEYIAVLEAYGLIKGIKMPNATIYSLSQILKFLTEYAGEDLSSRDAIEKLLERRTLDE